MKFVVSLFALVVGAAVAPACGHVATVVTPTVVATPVVAAVPFATVVTPTVASTVAVAPTVVSAAAVVTPTVVATPVVAAVVATPTVVVQRGFVGRSRGNGVLFGRKRIRR